MEPRRYISHSNGPDRLCINRPEGFGPYSALSAPIPTSCFVDTVLLPLPIYIAIVITFVCLPGGTGHVQRERHGIPRPKMARPHLITLTIYYLLIVCLVAMQALEIARLAKLDYGIGLLPFMFVGLLLAAFLHFTEGIEGLVVGWRGLNVFIWLGTMVMSIVKVVGLHYEGNDRTGSAYPMSDQILDVSVMAGVYAVLIVLEIVLRRWGNRITRPRSE
ncbi:hypothetical protein VHEMI10238 [[Torrubiella] hemipterigena]|uniref:Uncharacterized protein n=1 Tax=[Torrubiella] hemipterigena TaxID=1531966 RepID=A0A0A1TT03_9HYPO|nr:hypothetical protein VHEMI10238 [[Torrubiella] hemipterigena]